jgi:hypothetical protein
MISQGPYQSFEIDEFTLMVGHVMILKVANDEYHAFSLEFGV